MTKSEAIEKLRAYHKCQGLQVKGNKDCHKIVTRDYAKTVIYVMHKVILENISKA